jgi:exodeoxyribonuclease VII large subunit
MMDHKLSLLELNQWIKNILCETIPGTVWVVAEISELKENRNGHCYIELVEKQGNEIVARARATIWSYTYRMLKPYFESITGQSFSCGIKILVNVVVEFHPSYGLSLNIKDIDPAYTMGDMMLQRKEIIERLQSEGIFDMNRELTLPMVPQRIAVISSKTAAGYLDFINQLEHNAYGIKFYTKLFEAYMQGTATVPSIIAALEKIFQYEEYFDAVAIIRGGGATADLSSFDNYDLAFYVTQFPLPVITGIGHEKDDTIIDLVAHTRLKTPTAVAEFFISGARQFYDKMMFLEELFVKKTREVLSARQVQLEENVEGLQNLVNGFIYEKNMVLVRKGSSLHSLIKSFSFNRQHELNHLKHDLRSGLSLRKVHLQNNMARYEKQIKWVVHEAILKKRSELEHLKQWTKHSAESFLLRKGEQLTGHENLARLLNPENVLKRGYTITYKGGRIVKSSAVLYPDDEIETRFTDGSVKSKIIKKEKHVD